MEQIHDCGGVGRRPRRLHSGAVLRAGGDSQPWCWKSFPGGQMATTSNVENYPGFAEGVDGFDLAMQMRKTARSGSAWKRCLRTQRLWRWKAA